MLEELKSTEKVVGVRQIRKAFSAGRVKKVFLAKDADPALTEPLARLCEAASVSFDYVPTMKQLGTACEISVPAAAAAIV